MKIALRLRNGQYVCAENGGDDAGIVHANRRAIGPWETWTVTRVSDNRIALQSEQGRFLCAEGAGGAEVHANRRALGPWEQFTLTDVLTSGAATALRTNDDRHYLGVTGETVDARSTTPVLFDVTILEGDKPTALHIEGLDFIDEHGAPWKMAGNTLYVLFRQYLEGQDIEPFLKENEDLGVNCLAVGASQSGALGRLVPSEHPDFDAKVQAFTDLVGERGFRLLWIVFLDAQNWMPDANQQRELFAHFCDLVRGQSHVLVELGNENFKNGFSAGNFAKPDGILSCSGSGGAGDDPPQPFWDWCDLHSERSNNGWRTTTSTVAFAIDGYGTAFPGTHRPTVVREPPGFAESPNIPRRISDPRVAFAWGVGAATFGSGGAALTDSGNAGQLLGPAQRACVGEFVRGVKAAR